MFPLFATPEGKTEEGRLRRDRHEWKRQLKDARKETRQVIAYYEWEQARLWACLHKELEPEVDDDCDCDGPTPDGSVRRGPMNPGDIVCLPGRFPSARIESIDHDVATIRVMDGYATHKVPTSKLRPAVTRRGYLDDDGHWQHWRYADGGYVLPPPTGPMTATATTTEEEDNDHLTDRND